MPEIPDDNLTFGGRLATLALDSGFEAAACLRFDSQRYLGALSQFKSLRPESLASLPAYVGKGFAFKAEPASFVPWARSAIVALGAFSKLPEAPSKGLFETADAALPLAGLVAGYALRMDYHRYGLDAMSRLKEGLERIAGRAVRAEAFIDSNPLPERGLAVLAGLGALGRNACVVSRGLGAGVFIASLWTDFPFPEFLGEGEGASECEGCRACSDACPNSVFGRTDGVFECRSCAAALSSEFRGELSLAETALLGDWIFGCGRCVSACPGSRMPPPAAVDLEWLLSCKSSELEKALSGTAMERAGASLLRRNALAVLFNKRAAASTQLIESFHWKTGSSFLRSFSGSLLREAKLSGKGV